MQLEIRSFADAGDLANERLVLRALDDMDIGSYMILRSKADASGNPLSGLKTAYWLPDIRISKGDLVVLYTKTGKASKKILESGRTAHFYYWHQTNPLWEAEKKNTAVVLLADSWAAKSPSA
jgi:hypothetical protein